MQKHIIQGFLLHLLSWIRSAVYSSPICLFYFKHPTDPNMLSTSNHFIHGTMDHHGPFTITSRPGKNGCFSLPLRDGEAAAPAHPSRLSKIIGKLHTGDDRSVTSVKWWSVDENEHRYYAAVDQWPWLIFMLPYELWLSFWKLKFIHWIHSSIL